MSYDVYAYPPGSATPDKALAEAFLRTLEITPGFVPEQWTSEQTALRERIVEALLQHNPRLTRAVFNFAGIARRRNLTEEQARARYQHAQLNPPQEGLAIQLSVWRDHVFISIPFSYQGDERERVFAQLIDYLKVIRKVAGYFAYDRQACFAFDPIDTSALSSGY